MVGFLESSKMKKAKFLNIDIFLIKYIWMLNIWDLKKSITVYFWF